MCNNIITRAFVAARREMLKDARDESNRIPSRVWNGIRTRVKDGRSMSMCEGI